MATSTLIQYLESTDSAGAALGVTMSNRRQVETFIAEGAIAIGDAVAFNTNRAAEGEKTLYVFPADTDSQHSKCFVGVALEAAAAGGKVRVCISGVCTANLTAGNGASAGVNLMIGAAGGEFVDYSAGSVLQNAAITCNARDGSSGKATVVVFKQF